MSGRSWVLWLVVPLLVFVGCTGDEGPAGPAGPPGNDGDDTTAKVETYFGGRGADCMHCHSGVVSTVRATGHDEGFSNLPPASQADLYCLQCHTTGFDSKVAAPGDTVFQTVGPDTFGYDDYARVNTPEAAERRALLEGVQCESCHGPMGPNFNQHTPLVSFGSHEEMGVSVSLCTPCHDNQLTEWLTSGHANAAGGDITAFNDEHYAHVGSCQPCHTSEGFIWANDAAYGDRDFPHEVSFIGCPTCHDPHVGETAADGNPYQLRNLDEVEIAYHPGLDPGDPGVPTMDGYGTAQTCAQCHHARRGSTTGGDTGGGAVENQIANGYDHFGPHGSPQMDMFIGIGCYEIPGFDYSSQRTHGHQFADVNDPMGTPDGCVGCHMRTSADPSGHRVHDFKPSAADNCTAAGCHPGATDFDVNGVQTAITAKMDAVAAALGLGYTTAQELLDAWEAADPHGSESIATEDWQREAAYAIYFVTNDGSLGVHNPRYATALLDTALAHANAQP